MAKSRSNFPANWEIAGLYKEGRGTRTVDHARVRARDIRRADAIIVVHRHPRLGTETFRTIHGAKSKAQVGDLIRRVVQDVSPV